MIDSISLAKSPSRTLSLPTGPQIRALCNLDPQKKLINITLEKASSFEALFFGAEPDSDLLEWFKAYAKKQSSPLLIDYPKISLFRSKFFAVLQAIPLGQVLSYAEVAEMIGSPRAARAVGNACHDNPFPLIIPCHRVIASSGKLGGFAYPLSMKETLLRFEKS